MADYCKTSFLSRAKRFVNRALEVLRSRAGGEAASVDTSGRQNEPLLPQIIPEWKISSGEWLQSTRNEWKQHLKEKPCNVPEENWGSWESVYTFDDAQTSFKDSASARLISDPLEKTSEAKETDVDSTEVETESTRSTSPQYSHSTASSCYETESSSYNKSSSTYSIKSVDTEADVRIMLDIQGVRENIQDREKLIGENKKWINFLSTTRKSPVNSRKLLPKWLTAKLYLLPNGAKKEPEKGHLFKSLSEGNFSRLTNPVQ